MVYSMPGTPGYPGYGYGHSSGGHLGEGGLIAICVVFGIMFICVVLLCCSLCCQREEPVPVHRDPLAALVGPPLVEPVLVGPALV
jgi:hypothetical protein